MFGKLQAFATLALTQGVDLYTVSKLLGHKTIQATQIYAKIVDEKKKAAMELLPMIEISKWNVGFCYSDRILPDFGCRF